MSRENGRPQKQNARNDAEPRMVGERETVAIAPVALSQKGTTVNMKTITAVGGYEEQAPPLSGARRNEYDGRSYQLGSSPG